MLNKDQVEKLLSLCNAKLFTLKEASIIETDVDILFQYEQRITDLEQTINNLEKDLANLKSNTIPSSPASVPPTAKVLLKYLEEKFLMQNLKKICFLMDVEWGNLEGGTKIEKIISLIEFAKTRGQISQLWLLMQNINPNLN